MDSHWLLLGAQLYGLSIVGVGWCMHMNNESSTPDAGLELMCGLAGPVWAGVFST